MFHFKQNQPDNDNEMQHEHWQEHFRRHAMRHMAGRRGGPFGGGSGPFGGGGPFNGGNDGPFNGDDPRFGRKRQRRGDIRFALLALLSETPRHGYELIRALEEQSGGFYRPSPGMIYPTLQLLEDEGNLTSATVENKRVYTITDAGREVLKAHETARQQEQAEHEARHGHGRHHGPHREQGEQGGWGGRGFGPGGFGGFGGMGADMPQLQALRQSARAMFDSVMQTARYGTPEQIKALQALLERTTQEARAILTNKDSNTVL